MMRNPRESPDDPILQISGSDGEDSFAGLEAESRLIGRGSRRDQLEPCGYVADVLQRDFVVMRGVHEHVCRCPSKSS
jgi:hypothetical protein